MGFLRLLVVVFGVLATVSWLNAQSVQATPEQEEVATKTLPQSRQESEPKAAAITPEVRGDIFMARRAYRDAIEQYQIGIKEAAGKLQQAILYNKIGIAHHQMGQLNSAKKSYERAVKLNPKYAEAVNNIGTVHYANKSYRRAVNQYNKALKLAPKSASIFSNLGTAQFSRRKYKEALEAYQTALTLDPEVFEHRSTQGVLLQERSVEERAKFHFYLAKTYAKAEMYERALLYIRKALEEGFKERQKLREEPEFAKMQEMPEFQQLLSTEFRVL